MKGFVSSDVHGNSEMAADRPFSTKPSHDLLLIKLWAATLTRNARDGKTSMLKISKWPNLRPLALKNEIL